MAFEPINIFSRRIDPRGVVAVLRRSGLPMKVEGPEDDWKQIVLTVKKGGLLRKPCLMTFGHDSAYYDGDDWARQVTGIQGYFAGFADVPRKAEILQAIGNFRFALSVPQHDLDIDSDDSRLALLSMVCQNLDGVIFTPSSLRDAHGRVLIGGGGEADPQAVLPKLPPGEGEISGDETEDDEAGEDPVPPTPERVARRALALTAVAARATLELDAPELDSPDTHRQRLLEWVESLEIGDELEPEEWKVLQRPVGKLEQQDFVNAMWRVEGLAVLAWALGRRELPQDDELVIPPDLYQAMGIFDAESGRELLRSPALRSAEELAAMQTHLMILHWRLRDYSLRPQGMNFVAFSKSCWFGSFDISRFRIINNDLAIGGVAIDDAGDDERSRVNSLAMERHLAINWLMGYSSIYSETDTST
jgi:hypothetical protein